MENYELPINEEVVKMGKRFGRGGSGRGMGGISYTYTSTMEFVETNKRLSLVRGDVVRLQESKYLPKYARGQFGVVIDRFREVKDKGMIYKDYGSVVMLTTGPDKGRLILITSFTTGSISNRI